MQWEPRQTPPWPGSPRPWTSAPDTWPFPWSAPPPAARPPEPPPRSGGRAAALVVALVLIGALIAGSFGAFIHSGRAVSLPAGAVTPRTERTSPPASTAPEATPSTPPPTTSAPPSSSRAATSSNSSVRDSVVQIVGRGCGGEISGTGFVVEPGLVVTDAHVVAGVHNLRIDPDDSDLPVDIVAFDPDADLALLSAPGLAASPLTLAGTPAAQGDAVTSLGYSRGGPLQTVSGTVTDRGSYRVSDIWLDSYSGRELLATTLPVRGGDSGGPVLNSKSEVVGVVFAASTRHRRSARTEAFADDVSEVTRFLERRPAPSGTDRCAEDQVDIQ